MNKEMLFMDNGDWEYSRFSLVEVDNKVYFRDEEEDLGLKKIKIDGNLENVFKLGEDLGYFVRIEGENFYEYDLEEEVYKWLLG